MRALDSRSIDYHASIKLKVDGEYVETTPGRVALSEELPGEMNFLKNNNEQLNDSKLRALIADCYRDNGPHITVRALDAIKRLGFHYATKFGATIGMEDILVPASKPELINRANGQVEEIHRQYLQGHITNEERYNRVIEVWGM